MKNELTLNALISSMVLEMAHSIPDDQFHLLPSGGGNSPNWIMGHLCLGNGFGMQLLGHDPEILKLTGAAYGPGSTPTEDQSTLMSKSDLLTHFESSRIDLVTAIEKADPAVFAAPQQTSILTQQLPTVGDFVGHLLTTHVALHTGQLSAWRRSRGLDSIMKLPQA